jgi:Tfp pilus assembly protein PilN
MRPVNLLPDELRPRKRAGEGRGQSHIVIAVLGVLLVMAVAYALSLNQVNSHKTEIAAAKSEIEKAKTQVSASTAFGDFHAIEQTRSASVKMLAGGRFDWERMMRELALVLPAHTWLLSANAASSADAAGAGASGGASTPPPASGAAPSAAATGDSAGSGSVSPTLALKGCALRQNDVAVTLVRLRKLYRVDSVDLNESVQDTNDSGVQGSTDSAAGSDTCGSNRFTFDISVTFSPGTDTDKPAGGKVPAKLGGGS